MRVRFLMTTESQTPDYPFQAGQVIYLTGLTPEVRTWVKNGHAEILKDEPEAAVVAPAERAVTARARGRDRV